MVIFSVLDKIKEPVFDFRLRGSLQDRELQGSFAGRATGIDAGTGGLTATLLARLFKMPFRADIAHDSFAVQFFLQAAQGLFDALAFPDLHFCHVGVLTCLLHAILRHGMAKIAGTGVRL